MYSSIRILRGQIPSDCHFVWEDDYSNASLVESNVQIVDKIGHKI